MVTTTFCVSGAVLAKCGSGVNSNITNGSLSVGSDYAVDVWITEAESLINLNSRKNYVATYASLTAAKKYILQDAASNYAAIKAIQYDMGGYNSRGEAEDMINVLRDSYLAILGLLRDKKFTDYLDAT